MRKIFFYISFLSFLISNSFLDYDKNVVWGKTKSIDYKTLYYNSIGHLKNNELRESITLLKDVILNSKDKNLVMNACYDLGQIYLSRTSDYNSAIEYFEYIITNNFIYEKNKYNSDLKSLLELKQKSLFMMGYIYHNHIGNLTKAKEYYDLFLNKYSNHELILSIQYELEIINRWLLIDKTNKIAIGEKKAAYIALGKDVSDVDKQRWEKEPSNIQYGLEYINSLMNNGNIEKSYINNFIFKARNN